MLEGEARFSTDTALCRQISHTTFSSQGGHDTDHYIYHDNC
jgi:hypothetical protein